MKRILTFLVLGGAATATSLSAAVAAADPDATTVAVPDPFGVTFPSSPVFTYQASDAAEGIAYGHQSIDFDSANLSQPVEQFFLNNVTVNGAPITSMNELAASNVQTDVIDKLQDGLGSQQQILLPHIADTNIQSGVIGIHDFGGGYGYAYIDLVGPGVTSVNSDGVDNAVGAFLVTPTGTFDVSHVENGGDYGGLAYLESQLFDFSKPLANPFGIELTGNPDFNYQTAGVFGNTAYGSQDVKFESDSLAPFAQKFFDENVTIGGQAFGPTSTLDVSHANIIDSLNYTGIDNGFSAQQLFLPAIEGTNVDNGVITLQSLGDGFSYDSINLDLTGSSSDAVGAWLVTPYGDIDVSPWASLAAQMFDPSYFDIGSFPADGLIPPTFDFLF
ncbi:hypothetical protein [Mycobacterium sp.]|uniref:hypothetical protein n=1 Tax=Mycobacterium sp. TaxID=1785 RepID=UPI003D0EB7F3